MKNRTNNSLYKLICLIILITIVLFSYSNTIFATTVQDIDWCSDIMSNENYKSFNFEEITDKNMDLLYTYTFSNSADADDKDDHYLSGGAITDNELAISFHNYQETKEWIWYFDINELYSKKTKYVLDEDKKVYYTELGHSNDMAYNNITNELYVYTNIDADDNSTKKIAVIDSTTKNFKHYAYFSGNWTAAWEITYDKNKKKYYAFSRENNTSATADYYMFEFNGFSSSNNYVYQLTSNDKIFTVTSPNATSTAEATNNLTSHLGVQSMSTYNNLFYIEWWQKNTNQQLNNANTVCKGYRHTNYIFVYDTSGNIEKILFIPNTRDRNDMANSGINVEDGIYAELEMIDFDSDGNMILTFGRNISQNEDDIANNKIRYKFWIYKLSRFDLLDKGKVNKKNKMIYNVLEKTKYSDLKAKTSTYGTVLIDDENSIAKTGDKYKVKLENTTDEYKISVTGDVTGDGKNTINDIKRIANHIIDKNVITKDEYLKAADYNGDGEIHLNDAMKLLNYVKNN